MRNYGDYGYTCNPHDDYMHVTGNTLSLSSLSSLFKRRTVTTDMHFLLHCIHTNEFILYSGSQSYIAASFSTVRGYETRRKVFGDPFNGRPLPE